jgi:uncharacterized damage-inducible protein DinB
MDTIDLLRDGYGRLPELVDRTVRGLSAEALVWAPDSAANSIGWLVWHLTRVQDSHIAELTGNPQVWEAGDWAARFGLGRDPDNTGYGHAPEDVARVQPEDTDALTSYFAAVYTRTRAVLDTATEKNLDRVVDDRWDPPVTLGVRLISVLADDLQHIGQAAYLRGLLDRA